MFIHCLKGRTPSFLVTPLACTDDSLSFSPLVSFSLFPLILKVSGRERLQGHRGMVMCVAWSPDGTRLASGGGGRGRGELFVWCAHSGELLRTLSELSEIVY